MYACRTVLCRVAFTAVVFIVLLSLPHPGFALENSRVAAPAIKKLSPLAAGPGGLLTITGQNFGSFQGTGKVFFGSVNAGTARFWSNTNIIVRIPFNAQTGLLKITVASGGQSKGVEFSVLATGPSHIRPDFGDPAGGTRVTLFSPVGVSPAQVNIVFNSAQATDIKVIAPNIITCTTPAGSGAANVMLMSGSISAKVGTFTYGLSPPVIQKLSPLAAKAGDVVVINGHNFGVSGTGNRVFFGFSQGGIQSWSDAVIRVRVPKDAVTGLVSVQTLTQTSNSVEFAILPASPKQIRPESGPSFGGTRVSILAPAGVSGGTSFTVLFGSVPAKSVSFIAPRTIVCTTPGGAAAPVEVFVKTTTTTKVGTFQYGSGIFVLGISPPAAKAGNTVTIGGAGFGSAQGANKVLFGSVDARTALTWSDSRITIRVPSSAKTGPVTVEIGGKRASPVAFAVLPSSGNLLPASGPASGGTNVTILTPMGLSQTIVTVSFGTNIVHDITIIPPSTIVCRNPKGSGNVNVTVTSNGIATTVGTFTYQ